MKMVFILRGLPGSGKSSFAAQQEGAVICNADKFHMVDGVYMYDQGRAAEGHEWCLRGFIEFVISGEEFIVVDNTNTSSLEIAPYYRIARAYGYSVRFYLFECSIVDSIKNNVHGVPEDVICRMAMRLTRCLPESWLETSEALMFGSPHEKAE